jgi:hypothetical protein
LAALHYNQNSDRKQNINKTGEMAYKIKFPKSKKGGYTVQPVKESATYGECQHFFFKVDRDASS